MPIIRRNPNGKLIPELRQWGFIMMVRGKTSDRATGAPMKVRRDVFNDTMEKTATNNTCRCAFREPRGLVPISG